MAEINAHGLIKPKPFTTHDMDGKPVSYVLSRFPATVAREILCQYPMTAMPKLGDYPRNHELMLKLMSYVSVDSNGTEIRLNHAALVDNHVADGETLLRIEHAMLEYNCGFFRSGQLSNFFDECLRMVLAKISETSTRSSQPSPVPNSQPSENSASSTT